MISNSKIGSQIMIRLQVMTVTDVNMLHNGSDVKICKL